MFPAKSPRSHDELGGWMVPCLLASFLSPVQIPASGVATTRMRKKSPGSSLMMYIRRRTAPSASYIQRRRRRPPGSGPGPAPPARPEGTRTASSSTDVTVTPTEHMCRCFSFAVIRGRIPAPPTSWIFPKLSLSGRRLDFSVFGCTCTRDRDGCCSL